jgi:hypothetical protein
MNPGQRRAAMWGHGKQQKNIFSIPHRNLEILRFKDSKRSFKTGFPFGL